MMQRISERDEALAARARVVADLGLAEHTVTSAGVQTTYLEGGDGPPMVLLHGQGGSALAWAPAVQGLARQHRVVVPDLPGLGESTPSLDPIDEGSVGQWLSELVVGTCDSAPVIVGMSLGGSIAARFAIRRGHECAGVVLVDSGSLGPFRPDPRVIPALVRVSVRPSERNIERFFSHTVVDLDGFRGRMGASWADFLVYGRERNADRKVKSANRRWLRSLGVRTIAPSDLATISCPVSLIWGRDDVVMRLKIAERAAEAYGWELNVLDRAGHACLWDRPDAFVVLVEAATASWRLR